MCLWANYILKCLKLYKTLEKDAAKRISGRIGQKCNYFNNSHLSPLSQTQSLTEHVSACQRFCLKCVCALDSLRYYKAVPFKTEGTTALTYFSGLLFPPPLTGVTFRLCW